MLLNKSGSLRRVAVKFSRLNFGFLLAAHALAVFALSYPLMIPVWIAALLWLSIIASFGFHFIWKNAGHNRINKIINYANGCWCIVFETRSLSDLSLDLNNVHLSSFLIILPFTFAKGRYSCELWCDSVSKRDWRLLHSMLSQQISMQRSIAKPARFSSKL